MIRLRPDGAARARFLARSGRDDDAPGEALVRLAAAARACDLAPELVYLGAELARTAPALDERGRGDLALLAAASLVHQRRGSTRLPLAGAALHDLCAVLLRTGGGAPGSGGAPGEPEAAGAVARIERLLADPALTDVVGGPEEYRPLVVADGHLYHQRLWWCEARLIAALGGRLVAPALAAAPSAEAVDAALADVRARPSGRVDGPVVLAPEQEAAVRAGATRRLTVVSGGPGTGKTAILVALLRVLARLGVPPGAIVLAAPTGKAAQRMRAALEEGLRGVAAPAAIDERLAAACPIPVTVHRLLGWQPDRARFRHHEGNRLGAAAIIVDEASMLDLVLAERLVRAAPEGARLILLGDADQLPSVDPGAVLRDLATAGGDAVVRLGRVWRVDTGDPAGVALAAAAERIRAGDAGALVAPSAASPVRRRAADVAFAGLERLDGDLDGLLARWLAERVDVERLRPLGARVLAWQGGEPAADDRALLSALLAHHERSRLLTVTRVLETGSEEVSERLHRALLSALGVDRRTPFWPGEPILVTENDYGRGLFNGDAGVVARVSVDGGPSALRAIFPRDGGLAAFGLEQLRGRIELAYALTVHRAQGSEHDHVALILPHADLPLATRELVYTAVTRARRSALLVGGDDVLRAAVSRRGERDSGLAAGLAAVVARGRSR